MYTILNNNLQVKGKLTLDNGQGSTAFFGDAITQQIATDNSTDPNNLTTQAFNETDKQGNSKSWGHSLTLSCENTAIGSSITTADSILYLDNVSNKYYLMKIIDISGDRNSGFWTINAVNTAVYELGKKLFNTEKTYTRASLADVVKDVYKDVPFSLRIEDDLETVIDYTISAGTSAQAIFQDLQTKYDVDIDSWVELDNSGNLSERVLYFGHLGTDNGELIRYGGAKGFENITAQEVSDTIYTKLWVNGQTDDKNPNNGHIGSVNNGLEYIIDDVANAREYPIGANQQQPAYLEGIITNNLLSEPQALLDWAKLQMPIFNHARFNYTVTPLHDQVVGIGDTVAVQDFHMQPMILVTSKVIQKVTSFASPETNTFVLGEFSNIFTEQLNKNSNVITLIKKDVTVVQEAADNARVAADEAHMQAVIAQSKAIQAQATANGKTKSFTVASVEDLPVKANEGDIAWVTLEDGTHGYTFINGHWIEDINPNLKKSIQDGVTEAVSQAKSHVDEVKQVLSTDIATAKSQAVEAANEAVTQAKSYTATAIEQNNASQQEVMNDIAKSQADLAIKDGDFINKAQAMADKALSDAKANIATVASKSLGTYLVRLLPGTNIFKTTNSTTIQAQVWKAGQDITSTLDNASFSWKLAKDGANAIGLTNNVKNITAKPSDFTNTGTYIVNVIIPVTDTTGTTRNQTFSDSVTIAKVADGATGTTGNGISSTTITYAVSASGTNAPTSGYTSTIPTVNKGQFLWQRTATSYTNGTTKNSDVVTYFAKDGLNGVPGMDGGQGMIAQPSKPTSGLVDGFLWLDTSQTYPVYYIYDSSIKDFKIYQFNAKNINADQIKAKFVGTDRLSASEIIADDLHVKSANIDGRLTASQITVSSTDGSQTSLANFNLGEMSQTISDTKNAINSLGQVNQLFNTEFTPDLQGWTLDADKGSNAPYASFVAYGSRGIGFYTLNADANTYASLSQTVQLPSTRLSTDTMSLTWRVNTRRMDNYCHIWLVWQDINGVSLGKNTMGNWNDSTLNEYNVLKWENISIPIDAKQVRVSFETREGTNAYIFQPMVSFTDTIGTYVAGAYNNNAALAQVKITADGVSSIVSDPQKGLSVRVQTAEGTLNTVKSTADGAMSKANQTANDITQEISDRGTGDTNTLQSAKNFTQSSISGYDSGLQTQLTQTSSALLATVSASNLVLDSSLTDSAFSGSIVNWIPSGAGKWYYSPGVSYQGVQSMGYNQSSLNGDYSFVDSQPWGVNSFSDSTLNVSVDVRANNIGGTSTDYLIVTLMEQDNNGNQTQRTDITGTISKTNNNWVNYRKKITIDPLSRTFFIRYQMRGNGNVYVARPYVGVQELIPGGYTAGTNNNNQTILSLFKDSWSIGITDNIGKITSGIVGNSSSMSLISKNIVLDGNTTFTALKKTVSDADYAASQVKNTADSISNFVRDSSGNLSSNFQTALSRTSIITGSTLSTSIQKQTATQISSALTDNNGKIISLINQDSSGVQIYGKNIVLDGNTTVTGTFKVSQANIANGAIGTAQIGDAVITSAKIANLDVSKLTGDTITGFNFNVNRSLTVAPGGTITSDIVNMTKTDFMLKTNSIANSRTSSTGYRVDQLGQFNIDTMLGGMYSQGTITTFPPNSNTPERTGNYLTQYNTNNIYLSALNYSNKAPNEYMNISSAHISIIQGGDGLQANATDYAYLNATLFSTTGSVQAGGTVSSKHIMLNDTHGIVILDNVDLYLLGANGNPVGMHGKSWSNSSLRSMKEHFSNVDPKYALDEVLKTDIKSYNFIGDDITDNYVSPIIDDTKGEFYIPKDFIDSTGKGVKTYSIDGYLIQSIKALQEQITELKQG